MQAGNLDRKIAVQKAITLNDEAGQPEKRWVLHSSPWAAFKVRRVAEQTESALPYNTRDAEFYVRYDGFITVEMRIIDEEGDVYLIKGLRPYGRREGLYIDAQQNFSEAVV